MLRRTSAAEVADTVCRAGTVDQAETTGLVQRASVASPAAAVEIEAGEQAAAQTDGWAALQADLQLAPQPLARPVAVPVA